jgi:hypothetical protein
VTIGGDLIGGSITGSTTLDNSGSISAIGHLGSVLIKGSIIAGSNSGSGKLVGSAAIMSVDADIGSITVMHDIVGNSTGIVQISAEGQSPKPGSGTDVAIGTLTVGGNVSYLNVLAGFSGDSATDSNANATISSIVVGGNWTASNAVAGASQGTPPYWGVGDTLQSGGAPSQPASITSIEIGGYLTGTSGSGDNFGFVAQQFGSISVGGHIISLTPGVIPEALTGDVYLEVI